METGASKSGDCKPTSGKKIKRRAPQPPKQPPIAHDVNNEHKAIPALGMLSDQNILITKGNLIKTSVDIVVVFPDGEERRNTVHRSKAVMDLFVDLCSQYHLNPAHYTFDLQSWENQQSLSYTPNTLIGTLDVQKIFLKVKDPEGKKIKRSPPKIPEKTVRLLVNYLKTQKTVVRVNPEIPLQSIIPIICEKCEISQECLVLLRDTFTGEKLELTKSLNDLGIKELYAWNKKKSLPSKTQSEPSLNYREQISTGCGTPVKEKKGLLGFFRTSKKNKAEKSSRTSLNLDGGELLKYRKQSLDETMTVNSSRSLCSVMVTSSLSLGNIPRTTASTEIKKRRAPPLPVILPFSGGEADREEKMQSLMSQSSLQHEVKKKKRRAPLPPTSTTPNRFEEMENKRQSTIGNEQQVPQKPPRGNTRDPPLLMIPPSPPYRPPDKDTVDPAALYNEADVTDPTQLVSERNVQLSRTYHEETAEETNSLSSCSMSKSRIDDSKVINLPSNIVSLAFQNDGINSRNKSFAVEKTFAGIDSVLVAEECSVNNARFKSDESKNIRQRGDGRMMEAKIEKMDRFMITGMPEAQPAVDKILAVPVTIIDEIPKNYTVAHSTTEEEKKLFSKIEASENIHYPENSVKLTDLVKLISTNKNIESVSVGTSSYSPKNLSQKSSTEIFWDQTEEQHSESIIYTFSNEKQNKKNAVQKSISKNYIDSGKLNAQGITDKFKLPNKINDLPNKARSLNENNISDELNKSHLELKGVSAKNPNEKEPDATQYPWRRCVNKNIKNYFPKTGVTTFKVVPPKPKIRDFDRNQSLYTGAIKIDELGNLVTPNRKIIVNAASKVAPFGRAKEYKRSNSIEKQTEKLPIDHFVEAEIMFNSKQPNKTSRTKPGCIRNLKTGILPIVDSNAENIVGPDETKLPSSTSHFSGGTVLTPVTNMPQRKSSNDYLTSAVTNCNDLTQFKTTQGKKYEEELYKTKGVRNEIEPFPKECTVATKYCPVETEPAKTKELYSTTFSFSKNVSNTTPSCADSRVSNIKTPKQNKSINSNSGPFTKITSNQNSLKEQELIHNLVLDVTDREMTFVIIKKPSDQVSSFLSKPNVDSSATIFSSHVKSSNIPSTLMVNQTTLKEDEKRGNAENKLCPNRVEDNVYNMFGPKKKFKSVIQKSLPKDTSLHSALMDAIQNAGGKDKLRKISHSTISGTPKKSTFMETETKHSALLAAIKGHSGISTLRKISSFASDELQRFRNAEETLKNNSSSANEQQCGLPPPTLPLSPAQLGLEKSCSLPRMTDSPGNSRQALMEEIRSVAGAAYLRKVPLL